MLTVVGHDETADPCDVGLLGPRAVPSLSQRLSHELQQTVSSLGLRASSQMLKRNRREWRHEGGERSIQALPAAHQSIIDSSQPGPLHSVKRYAAAVVSRANRARISSAALTVVALPPRSFVRAAPPAATASNTAFSTAFASASNPSECRSNIAALRIVPTGFAIPFPAMSGADP